MAGNQNSGRRRKSKALRDLHGSVDRAHHRERAETAYPVEVPAPPETLSPPARAEWDRIVGLLNTQRVIAQVDLAVLAVYCSLFGRLEQIRAEMTKPSFRLLRKGKEHPLVRMERQISAQLRPYLAELGLTPASRARVSPLPPLVPPDESRPSPAATPAPTTEDFDALEAQLTGTRKGVSH